MATFEGRVLDIKEAERLNHLASFEFDAHRTVRFCDAYIELAKADKWGIPSGDCADALRIAIVSSYSRMFSTGVREKIPIEMAETRYDDEQKDMHTYLMALRDKHIAHSVNGFEEWQTTVMVNAEAEELSALSIGGSGLMTLGVGNHEVEQIKKMCAALMSGFSEASGKERASLLEFARQMSVNDLAKLPRQEARRIDRSKVAQRRK